jgi:zinc transporter 6
MLPLSLYTGRILLQTAPPHMITQLDRCIRECETLEGVLVRVCVCAHLYLFISQELTGAHFWQLDFNRMCGSVVVRVRREADEQQVLAYVTEKLSSVIAVLTVQIVKSNDYEQLGRTGVCVCVCR